MSEMRRGELVLRHLNGVTRTGPFRLTPTGLEVDGEPDFDAWAACGAFLQRAGQAVQWWVGDWLNYGEKRYGETYAQAMDATGLPEKALRNFKWVAARVELSRRRDNVPFSTHAEVASLPPADADPILARAEAEQLSSRQVRALVRELKAASKPPGADDDDDDVDDDTPARTDTAAECVKTVLLVARRLRQARDLLSALCESSFGEAVSNASLGHTHCELYPTGKLVEAGRLGPIQFGCREHTCDALDELLGFCGSLGVLFRREADRLPQPSANGHAPAPWDTPEE